MKRKNTKKIVVFIILIFLVVYFVASDGKFGKYNILICGFNIDEGEHYLEWCEVGTEIKTYRYGKLVGDQSGKIYITLEKGDFIKLYGYKYHKVNKEPMCQPKNGIFESGMYKVGSDIKPGKYILDAAEFDQYPIGGEHIGEYQIRSNSKPQLGDYINYKQFKNTTEIQLKEGEYISFEGFMKYSIKE